MRKQVNLVVSVERAVVTHHRDGTQTVSYKFEPLTESECREVAENFERSATMISAQLALGVERIPLLIPVGTDIIPSDPTCRHCGKTREQLKSELGYVPCDPREDGPRPVMEASLSGTSSFDGSWDCGCALRAIDRRQSENAEILRKRMTARPEPIKTPEQRIAELENKLAALEGK